MIRATVVMYHIVQPAGRGVLARLKGRSRDEFAGQIGYIKRHYTPVDLTDLARTANGACELPPNPIALTFDDGYASHASVVATVLADAGMPATFFPAASSLIDRSVLNVNKIQCVLAAGDAGEVMARVESAIPRDAAIAVTSLRAQWLKPSRWDPAEVVYVKRLLQHALPDAIREPLLNELFHDLVTVDERSLADELYMTVADARSLVKAGMTIGAHADRHVRLTTLGREAQAAEIDGALRVLEAAGASTANFVYSYANGEYDEHSIDLLRARGCAVAVTTKPELAEVTASSLLAFPRLDTNDLPIRADAEPNA